ncbi:MAG: rhomboid family intramembrane serine protease [Treponema sp.]|uniref:rhomboid family intramembrane serine protease n=1 Tax=Treponema sp. TaxID=166 RepID=UPI00298DC6E1|nr:rhomboid family intramembrane serine protease [Treponema sp.]MCQ2600752.1 rhomboid family intramembrane serine protease [Treponema sp.]
MNKELKINLRITFNSPVILTFCLVCAVILLLDKTVLVSKNFIAGIFSVPGGSGAEVPFNSKSVLDYIRLIIHVFGHADWTHLAGNLTFILLLGPLLEERYGSPMIALMMTVTAFVTGVLNACFMPTPLFGASGIAFMLIILASFTSISKNEVPLSFILVFIVFLGSEIFSGGDKTNISVVAHVAGGLCGSLFGFMIAPKAKNAKPSRKKKSESETEDVKLEEIDDKSVKKESWWNKKKTSKKSEDEEEVLGTIEL